MSKDFIFAVSPFEFPYSSKTRNGSYYQTDNRGAELLRQAVNRGYQQGVLPDKLTVQTDEEAAITILQSIVAETTVTDVPTLPFTIVQPATWLVSYGTTVIIDSLFRANTSVPVPGDYTGDGKADIALYDTLTNEWYVVRSENQSSYSVRFGASGDIPAAADYDGDGKTDFAIYRPSTTYWWYAASWLKINNVPGSSVSALICLCRRLTFHINKTMRERRQSRPFAHFFNKR